MSALKEPASGATFLASYAKDCPRWQQEALRRIVGDKTLEDEALADLLEVCRTARGLMPRRPVPETFPDLDVADVEVNVPVQTSLFLRGLTDISSVGALPDGSSLLFVDQQVPAQPCLVVVYGRNASGKSSFARILRAAGRSRAKRLSSI